MALQEKAAAEVPVIHILQTGMMIDLHDLCILLAMDPTTLLPSLAFASALMSLQQCMPLGMCTTVTFAACSFTFLASSSEHLQAAACLLEYLPQVPWQMTI